MSEIIDAYLAKANESLESAKDDLDDQRHNSCANRAYYTCYQAAVALLAKHALPSTTWEHEALQAHISILIKRKKVLPSNHKGTLLYTMAARLTADYEPKTISKQSIEKSG